jgi:hypothetical protein
MENSPSYLDWELQFKKKSKKVSLSTPKGEKLNSLGIPSDEFSSFLKKWTSKNLPKANRDNLFFISNNLKKIQNSLFDTV